MAGRAYAQTTQSVLNSASRRVLGAIVFVGLFAGCAPEPIIPSTPMPEPTNEATPTILVSTRTVAVSTLPATRTVKPTLAATRPPDGQPTQLPILMYHHLDDLPKTASELVQTWTVSPGNFATQITWLAQQGYHTVSMKQVIGYFRNGESLPPKPVVLTFDDGWEAGYKVAYPNLLKNGFRGTFFVYTNAIGHKGFLTWSEIEEMSKAGMEFASHSVSHPNLKTLEPAALAKQLSESKRILEETLSRPITAFAYPDGAYNDTVISALKRAGYEGAVGIASGYRQRPEDLFALHRIRVSYNDTLQEISARLP